MTENQKARREASIRFWQEVIRNCQDSGLSIAEYCRRNDLNANAYYYWQRQIRQELMQKQADSACLMESNPRQHSQEQNALAKPASATMDIVPLSTALDMAGTRSDATEHAALPSITMHYGRLAIDIRAGTPPELLRMVMSLIREGDRLCLSAS